MNFSIVLAISPVW